MCTREKRDTRWWRPQQLTLCAEFKYEAAAATTAIERNLFALFDRCFACGFRFRGWNHSAGGDFPRFEMRFFAHRALATNVVQVGLSFEHIYSAELAAFWGTPTAPRFDALIEWLHCAPSTTHNNRCDVENPHFWRVFPSGRRLIISLYKEQWQIGDRLAHPAAETAAAPIPVQIFERLQEVGIH